MNCNENIHQENKFKKQYIQRHDIWYISEQAPCHGFKIIAAWYETKDTWVFSVWCVWLHMYMWAHMPLIWFV